MRYFLLSKNDFHFFNCLFAPVRGPQDHQKIFFLILSNYTPTHAEFDADPEYHVKIRK